MNEIKKWGPAGFVAMLGVAASELVTKDKSMVWKVVGGGIGAGVALAIGSRTGLIKLGGGAAPSKG